MQAGNTVASMKPTETPTYKHMDGNVLRSDDGGNTWRELDDPTDLAPVIETPTEYPNSGYVEGFVSRAEFDELLARIEAHNVRSPYKI